MNGKITFPGRNRVNHPYLLYYMSRDYTIKQNRTSLGFEKTAYHEYLEVKLVNQDYLVT